MTNDQIVKIVCDIKNLSPDFSHPINEEGKKTDKDFDTRFILDRTYLTEFFNFTKRIRFVKYPNYNYVTIYINNMFRSNLEKTIEGSKYKHSNRHEIINLKEIEKIYKISERNKKINKIRNASKIE